MLLGFLDGQGRAYDLNFRTLKRRIRDADGMWATDAGEALAGEASVEAALFLQTEKPHLLMRPTSGTARASAKRLLFLAAGDVPRTAEEPTTFNVSVHVPPTAVSHLFAEMGGRELLEIRREEIQGSIESRAELTVRLEAHWIGGGDRPVPFLLVLRPSVAARRAIAPLGV